MKCANCCRPAWVRVGWMIAGEGWQEADMCKHCAEKMHGDYSGAIASLAIPAFTYGPVGQHIHARSRSADRDDAAALRGI